MLWTVELPVDKDKKGGKDTLSAAVTNGVNQTTVKSVDIQLIDPPTGGKIKGVVKLGEFGNGLEGATVILKDADGKDKDSTKTDKKGEYTFTDVPPA